MQGHALFVRQAGGVLPCPQVDFTGGFNGFLAAAYGLGNRSVEEAFGSAFDPFLNDQNFVLSVLTLEEFGATGNKVSALRMSFCCARRCRRRVCTMYLAVWKLSLQQCPCSALHVRFSCQDSPSGGNCLLWTHTVRSCACAT